MNGAELVQTDATRWYSELLFGDEQWTDYDFTVDAMRVGGAKLVLVVLPQYAARQ